MNRVFGVVALCLAFSPSLMAGTVAGFGGATELTQLSNNIQLGKAYVQEVRTALNSARQYQLMIENMRRNPERFAAQMLDPDVARHLADAGELAMMVNSLDSLHTNSLRVWDEKARAYGTIAMLRRQGHNVGLEDHHRAVIELARQDEAYWGQRVKRFSDSTEQAQRDIETVNRIAASSDGTMSQIQGLSNVVASNAVMSRQLASVSLALQEQSLMEADERRAAAADRRIASESQARAAAQREAFMRSALTRPPPPPPPPPSPWTANPPSRP